MYACVWMCVCVVGEAARRSLKRVWLWPAFSRWKHGLTDLFPLTGCRGLCVCVCVCVFVCACVCLCVCVCVCVWRGRGGMLQETYHISIHQGPWKVRHQDCDLSYPRLCSFCNRDWRYGEGILYASPWKNTPECHSTPSHLPEQCGDTRAQKEGWQLSKHGIILANYS